MRDGKGDSSLILSAVAEGLYESHASNLMPHALITPHTLVTAEIIYCLPDHPLLLQTYLWQDYDKAPEFPVLNKFITFWQRELDGKIHTVQLATQDIIKPIEFNFYAKEYTLH